MMAFGSSSAAFRFGVKPARARMDNVPTNKRDMVGLREYGKTWQRTGIRDSRADISRSREKRPPAASVSGAFVIPVYWPEGFTRKGNSRPASPAKRFSTEISAIL